MLGVIRKKIFPFVEVTLRYTGLVQQPGQIVARSSHDLSLSVRRLEALQRMIDLPSTV